MVDIINSIHINQKVLSKWRKALYKITSKSYWDYIPIGSIKEVLKDIGVDIIQEDGDEWEGFFCGSSGKAVINLGYENKLVNNSVLVLNWYGEEVHGLKGKVEINAYIT